MPEPKMTGRPAVYCSRVCKQRARQRVQRAARILDWADAMERHVGDRAFGSPEYVGSEVERAHAMAAELTAGLDQVGGRESGVLRSDRHKRVGSVASLA